MLSHITVICETYTTAVGLIINSENIPGYHSKFTRHSPDPCLKYMYILRVVWHKYRKASSRILGVLHVRRLLIVPRGSTKDVVLFFQIFCVCDKALHVH